MMRALLEIFAVALFGSLLVPVMMLTLARLGLFEPIKIGRWTFAPKKSRAGAG